MGESNQVGDGWHDDPHTPFVPYVAWDMDPRVVPESVDVEYQAMLFNWEEPVIDENTGKVVA